MEKGKQKETIHANVENIASDFNLLHSPMNTNEEETNEKTKSVAGHDLNDQESPLRNQQYSPTIQQRYSVRKFDGSGDAERSLKHIMEQFDLCGLSELERNRIVPKILTSNAKIWYAKHHEKMPTFFDFMKQFIHYFGNEEPNQKSPSIVTSAEEQMRRMDDLGVVPQNIENH